MVARGSRRFLAPCTWRVPRWHPVTTLARAEPQGTAPDAGGGTAPVGSARSSARQRLAAAAGALTPHIALLNVDACGAAAWPMRTGPLVALCRRDVVLATSGISPLGGTHDHRRRLWVRSNDDACLSLLRACRADLFPTRIR